MDYERLALRSIDENNVYDLYNEGKTSIPLPSSVTDIDLFALECISIIESLWGDPSVGFSYEEKEFDYSVEDGTLVITVA